MRLKDREDPLEVRGFRSAKRCSNFGGMMRVVIDDRDAVARLHLESPVDASKIFQGAGNGRRFDAAHVTHRCERSRGVQNVVHAGNVQLELLRRAAVES